MAKTPLTLDRQYRRDDAAASIAHMWFNAHGQRRPKIQEWKELRNYIFATDTSSTSNGTLPWKNSTTLPKLCQIRDNLHSNYLAALFPNDEWLKWIPYSSQDATRNKAATISAYMSNKTREGSFREEVSKLLYDYIDYGNAFATVEYENSSRTDQIGNMAIDYIGPKIRRISPLDIVFDPLASEFKDSWKIIRSMRSVGDLHAMAKDMGDTQYLEKALKNRAKLFKDSNGISIDDFDKEEGFRIDGFGSYRDYLKSGYVEVLDFYGDLYDAEKGTYVQGYAISVIDRMWVIRNEPMPGWFGGAPIYHVGWRSRPDNLWAMGPLDNLVGMQYRIDHLENLKADAMDLAVMPPMVIAGEVEEFEYAPGAEIHIDENGTVTELAKNVQWVIQADNAIALLEQRMEMYAGAPREAMGIRTPGEKTAYEVQTIATAAGRIFQEKASTFETALLEKALNAMLETARRNMDGQDVVRVLDNDLGVIEFRDISKEDITASGVLRPIGARHFAAQAQLMQNLTGVFSSTIGNLIAPHTSAKRLANLVSDSLGLGRYDLFEPNVAVFEQQETSRLMNAAQEDLQVENGLPENPLS